MAVLLTLKVEQSIINSLYYKANANDSSSGEKVVKYLLFNTVK